MRITSLETFHVAPRWLLAKITTDTGVVGWGEPVVEGRARTVETAVQEIGEYLVGQDPRRIEHHWQAIYRGAFYRGGPVLMSALSGVEQALWDIKGKDLGVPVYELLGGAVRDSIRMYAHCHADTVEDLVATAGRLVAAGFSCLKLATVPPAWPLETPAFADREVERVARVREAVGPEVSIAVDFHGRVSPALAAVLIAALQPYRLLFVEEPCLPENTAAMVDVARRTTTPIAAGERLMTRWQFRELLEQRAPGRRAARRVPRRRHLRGPQARRDGGDLLRQRRPAQPARAGVAGGMPAAGRVHTELPHPGAPDPR